MTEGQEKSTPQPQHRSWKEFKVIMQLAEKFAPILWEADKWWRENEQKLDADADWAESLLLKALPQMIDALRSVAGGEPEQWISVETGQVPAHRTWVIACVEHAGQRHVAPVYGIQLKDRWQWESEFPVTHWRPLPAPPQGKEQK